MNMNAPVTKDSLIKIVDPILDLVAKKNADYGGSVFNHGLRGIYIRMSDKVERLRRLVWDAAEAQVQSESVEDVFKDLIGYAALALTYMERSEDAEVESRLLAKVKAPPVFDLFEHPASPFTKL